ncbi:MAG: thiamine phosphate synthase [Comamonadaceae bacterium]|nr:thiamine phosphate synthase [Comamonadaceae bacterium]
MPAGSAWSRSWQRIDAALQADVRLIQVREGPTSRPLRTLASRSAWSPWRAAHGATVLINGDRDLARQVGADGMHLTSRQLMQTGKRPRISGRRRVLPQRRRTEPAAAELALDFAVLGHARSDGESSRSAGTGLGCLRRRLVRDCPSRSMPSAA